ncbi:MAG: signal peptidase I [Candidatus Thermoplasmatota archaeon]|nr:signal peptidase I [Candidatus Thermoplasmatota archaeon]
MDTKFKNGNIVFLIFIVLLGSIVLFSVDIPLVHQISQHPEQYYVSETVGISMYPQVYTGDIFVIQKSDSPNFSILIGDIIVFYDNEQYIGHRIIDITDDYVVTKGDFNNGYERVQYNQIVGKVIKTINRYNLIGQKVTSWISEN